MVIPLICFRWLILVLCSLWNFVHRLFLNLWHLIASEGMEIFWKSVIHKFVYVPQFSFCCSGWFMCYLYTVTLSINFALPPRVSALFFSKKSAQITIQMRLKLLQDLGAFNVNVLCRLFNVYSLNSNNYSHTTSSLLNIALSVVSWD